MIHFPVDTAVNAVLCSTLCSSKNAKISSIFKLKKNHENIILKYAYYHILEHREHDLLYEKYTNNYTKENAMRVKILKINRFAIFYYRLDRKY